MADEQYRWLDRGTAERLLRGEPPEAADPAARDQARRLAGALRALSAPPPSPDEELPGEAAALAAFRKLREEREGRAEQAPGTGQLAGTRPSDIGPVQIGAPRGERSGTSDGPRRTGPLRFGLAAALVAAMVGGAAVLAGTGVLSTPSDGSDPAASVTATGTHPERPLLSQPPKGGAPGGVTPEGGADSGGEPGGDGSGAPGKPGSDTGDRAARAARGGKQTAAACRAWRDGKELNDERERLLEEAAGGSSRVGAYCEGVLSSSGTSGTSGTSGGPDTRATPDTSASSDADGADEGAREGNGQGKPDGKSKRQGQGQPQGTAPGEAANKGNNGDGGKKNQ